MTKRYILYKTSYYSIYCYNNKFEWMPVDFLIAGLIKWIWLINGNQSEFSLIHQQRQLMKPAIQQICFFSLVILFLVIRYRMSWFQNSFFLLQSDFIAEIACLITFAEFAAFIDFNPALIHSIWWNDWRHSVKSAN